LWRKFWRIKMATLHLHTKEDVENVNDRRLSEMLLLTPNERMKKAFQLMRLALLFKNEPIKKVQGKGIVLKF
jgi:hypothetical protein